jgi:hypothetical protein
VPDDLAERLPCSTPCFPTLENASGVIANGYLRLDPQEWMRAVEKRRTAFGR